MTNPARYAVLALVPLGLLVFAAKNKQPSLSFDKEPSKQSLALSTMMGGLEAAHFNPMPVDDQLSMRVYDLYLKRIDPSKKFLTAADEALLHTYRTQVDDQINSADFSFLDKVDGLFDKRKATVKGFYKELLVKPFDFTKAETLVLDADKAERPATEASLKETWRKYLKYQTMVRVADMLDRQEGPVKADDTDAAEEDDVPIDTAVAGKTFAQLEASARSKVLKSTTELFANLDEVDRDDHVNAYFETIANSFDPHTDYLAPQDKANFDIQMTGRLEGIGATLQERDGKIKVASIVPGGPAYRQGDLKAGDYILKVAQAKGDPVDVTDMRLDKAILMIRGKKGTTVRLFLQKADGTSKTISIQRDIVVIEETYAQSALIGKTGYIKLPVFYDDFNNNGGRSSADDVRKELNKLKAAGAENVILDLRDNGGGSLGDAVKLAGLFVENGPMVQVKASNGQSNTLEDRANDVVWSGPLVVMVNEFSASASEIVAAAIQDYRRGIIVGSQQTFGKGTVQQIFNLDDYVRGQSDLKPLGSVKLTTQKFYRINGGATQIRGVASDVVLPDIYKFSKFAERDEAYPMKWDEINKSDFKGWRGSYPRSMKVLAENSARRVQASETFKIINEEADRLKQQGERVNYTLNLADYRKEQKQSRLRSKRLKELEKINPKLTVSLLPEDAEAASKNGRTEVLNEFKKRIQRDVYLEEVTAMFRDWK